MDAQDEPWCVALMPAPMGDALSKEGVPIS